jgi:hypothetical protein
MKIWLCLLILLPTSSAFAQIVPAPSSGPANPVMQFQANGFGYQYDLSGRSTSLYDMGNGMTGYTSRDQNGYVTGQGTIFTPMQSKPLTFPPGWGTKDGPSTNDLYDWVTGKR